MRRGTEADLMMDVYRCIKCGKYWLDYGLLTGGKVCPCVHSDGTVRVRRRG